MTTHNRQLAAIMFTDIVGFTALMGHDEEKGLDLLQKNRKIHKPLIEELKGTWIKEMGDGVLARFDSAYNAVKCAIEIQRKSKIDLEAQLRVGIHLGEVVIENLDIFGDGVNVTSRIESLADPGAIYVSEPVHKALLSHADIRSEYLATVHLKNVDELVKIYFITNDGIATPTREKRKEIKRAQNQHERKIRPGILIALALLIILALSTVFLLQRNVERQIKSIAVLPFANLTRDQNSWPIVDMMHDAVIGEISKIGELAVTSRTSTLQFKNTNLTIPEIGRILNVDALIESSVLKIGDSIFMQVQLIKARPREDHINTWDFRRDGRYIHSLYGDIAKSIAEEVEISLTVKEKEKLTHKQQVNPQVYNTYLEGRYHLLELSKAELERSKEYFERVLEIEPDHALAHTGLSMFYVAYAQQGHISFFEASPPASYHAKRALEENDQLAEVYHAASWNAWMHWELDEYLAYFRKALELNPNYADVLAFMAQALVIEGLPEEAIKNINKAMELDPLNDTYKALYTMCLYFTGKNDEAYSFINEAIEKKPEHPMLNSSMRAVFHAQEMHEEEYQSWLKKYSMAKDSTAVTELKRGYDSGGYEVAIQNLIHHLIRKFKYTPEYVPAWQIATLYARIEDKKNTVDWLERAYDQHSISLPFILIDPLFDSMWDDENFADLVNKLNMNR